MQLFVPEHRHLWTTLYRSGAPILLALGGAYFAYTVGVERALGG